MMLNLNAERAENPGRVDRRAGSRERARVLARAPVVSLRRLQSCGGIMPLTMVKPRCRTSS